MNAAETYIFEYLYNNEVSNPETYVLSTTENNIVVVGFGQLTIQDENEMDLEDHWYVYNKATGVEAYGQDREEAEYQYHLQARTLKNLVTV